MSTQARSTCISRGGDHSDSTQQEVQALIRDCDAIEITMSGMSHTVYSLTFYGGEVYNLRVHYRNPLYRILFDYWKRTHPDG